MATSVSKHEDYDCPRYFIRAFFYLPDSKIAARRETAAGRNQSSQRAQAQAGKICREGISNLGWLTRTEEGSWVVLTKRLQSTCLVISVTG